MRIESSPAIRVLREPAVTAEKRRALADGMAAEPGSASRPGPSDVDASTVPGPLLFAKYAYPPNSLGYCGPRDSASLLGYGSERVVDDGLRQLARGFEAAYPYLELIARASGIADPFDRRVVEA